MSPLELLEHLEAHGARLSEGERGLRIDAPAGVVTPALRELLARHKPDLLDLLFEREERAVLMGATGENGTADFIEARDFITAATDPRVREVLRIFGGEIVSVRPLEMEETKVRAA